jgi:hypothetical protein
LLSDHPNTWWQAYGWFRYHIPRLTTCFRTMQLQNTDPFLVYLNNLFPPFEF